MNHRHERNSDKVNPHQPKADIQKRMVQETGRCKLAPATLNSAGKTDSPAIVQPSKPQEIDRHTVVPTGLHSAGRQVVLRPNSIRESFRHIPIPSHIGVRTQICQRPHSRNTSLTYA